MNEITASNVQKSARLVKLYNVHHVLPVVARVKDVVMDSVEILAQIVWESIALVVISLIVIGVSSLISVVVAKPYALIAGATKMRVLTCRHNME